MGMQRPPFSLDLDRVGSAGEKGFRSGFGMGCAAAGGCGRRVSMGDFGGRKPFFTGDGVRKKWCFRKWRKQVFRRVAAGFVGVMGVRIARVCR